MLCYNWVPLHNSIRPWRAEGGNTHAQDGMTEPNSSGSQIQHVMVEASKSEELLYRNYINTKQWGGRTSKIYSHIQVSLPSLPQKILVLAKNNLYTFPQSCTAVNTAQERCSCVLTHTSPANFHFTPSCQSTYMDMNLGKLQHNASVSQLLLLATATRIPFKACSHSLASLHHLAAPISLYISSTPHSLHCLPAHHNDHSTCSLRRRCQCLHAMHARPHVTEGVQGCPTVLCVWTPIIPTAPRQAGLEH